MGFRDNGSRWIAKIVLVVSLPLLQGSQVPGDKVSGLCSLHFGVNQLKSLLL